MIVARAQWLRYILTGVSHRWRQQPIFLDRLNDIEFGLAIGKTLGQDCMIEIRPMLAHVFSNCIRRSAGLLRRRLMDIPMAFDLGTLGVSIDLMLGERLVLDSTASSSLERPSVWLEHRRTLDLCFNERVHLCIELTRTSPMLVLFCLPPVTAVTSE